MRLAPRSFFGRLVLVLLAGLLVAQAATVYINATERDQLLNRVGGMRLAQRIADIARLLDSLPPAERRNVAAVFDGPPLAVSLTAPRISAGKSESDFQLTMFSSMVGYALGDGLVATVARAEGVPIRRPLPPMMGDGAPPFGMHPHMAGPGARPGIGLGPGGAAFVVQVALRDGSLATFHSHLSPQAAAQPARLALSLLALIAVVVVLSLIAVRWLTVPLRTLAQAAERLGTDLRHPPLDERGPEEVRQAARAFNTMQKRLADSIDERTRVFTAMSHDLKTPITRMRLRAEMLDDESARARFEKDLAEMEAMVTQTLDYMRDGSREEAPRPIDVAALLESLQNDYREAGGEVRIEGRASSPYVGRPGALRRCLVNLVDNAIRYGRRATVSVEDGPGALTLRVRDEGPGLPPEQLERVFEPFYRAEASRSRETGGTGLGLGIARNIARAHGGELLLRNRPEGGLEATLTLPRRAAPDPRSGSAPPRPNDRPAP